MPFLGPLADERLDTSEILQFLKVGVEVEILLQAKQPELLDSPHLNTFAESLSQNHNSMIPKGQKRMHTDLGDAWEGPRFSEWSLTIDESIKGDDKLKSIYGLEIISPILDFDDRKTYRTEVKYMFSRLQRTCNLYTNDSCATHIHLSPADGTWGAKELKKVCKAIIYFEEAFEVLVPPPRRHSNFCRSNRFDNPRFSKVIEGGREACDLTDCFKAIDRCLDTQSLAEIMGMRKFMAWNFVNVYYSGWSDDGGTIEFRRPPGVTTVEDCLSWMELAMYFVHAARELRSPISSSETHFSHFTRDVRGLYEFIETGINNGVPKPTDLQRLFLGKSGRLAPILDPTRLLNFSQEEWEVERVATCRSPMKVTNNI